MKELTVSSPVFAANQKIPEKYSCDNQDINPPLTIEGVPGGTKSLALILNDPDAARGSFDHWIMWNIPPSQKAIEEDTALGTKGLNGKGGIGYTGPCPPQGKPHHYIFMVYALDTELALAEKASRKDLEKAMKGHVLAEGKLVGLFGR
jgi:Raf kinase inhibitor-like YbhB/YbcL family protein